MGFNLYGCGGAGLTIIDEYAKNGSLSGYVNKIVGLDASNANKVTADNLNVYYLPDANGSGGFRGKNIKDYPDFIRNVLAENKPEDINIIVYSGSGGSGSGIGPLLHRHMLEKHIPAVSMVIGDSSTYQELVNSVGTIRSLYQQCKLGHPVVYMYYDNNCGRTQGEINTDVCSAIDACVVTLSTMNQRVDKSDIENLFFFNDVIPGVDPILSKLDFAAGPDIRYDRRPVASISLYSDINDIKQEFPDLLYRKAGIFAPEFSGVYPSLHAILDHGDSLKELEEHISKLDNKRSSNAGKFKADTSLFDDNADDLGICL